MSRTRSVTFGLACLFCPIFQLGDKIIVQTFEIGDEVRNLAIVLSVLFLCADIIIIQLIVIARAHCICIYFLFCHTLINVQTKSSQGNSYTLLVPQGVDE